MGKKRKKKKLKKKLKKGELGQVRLSKVQKGPKLKPAIVYSFLLLIFLNYVILYAHNDLLPFIYLFLTVAYLFLNSNIDKHVDWNSGFEKVFLGKPFRLSLGLLLHWLFIIFFPTLVTLYYFDFTLSFVALLGVAILIYVINKKEKEK